MKTEDLISQVSSLAAGERARVADHILRSLNPPNAEIDRKWAALPQRRAAELRSGRMEPVPGEDVFAMVWKRFGV